MTSVSGDDDQGVTTSGEPSPEPRKSWLRWWMVVIAVVIFVAVGWATTMRKDSTSELDAQAAVAGKWQTFPGLDDPTALRYTRCESTGKDTYKCVYKSEGQDRSINIRWTDGSTPVKVFAGGPVPSAGRGSEEVAAALAKDDQARGDATASYKCAGSSALSPDGTMQQGTATGFQCFKKGTKGLRYVEFDFDGYVVKDFLVAPSSDSTGTPPAA